MYGFLMQRQESKLTEITLFLLLLLSYRASHIILDYLQSLTPTYAHYTQKIHHFLQKKFLLALLNFSK